MRNTNLPSPARLRGASLSYTKRKATDVGGSMVWKAFDLLQLERRGIVFYGLFVLLERECASSVFEGCLDGH